MSKVSSSLLSGGVGNGRGAGGVAEGGAWGRGGGIMNAIQKNMCVQS